MVRRLALAGFAAAAFVASAAFAPPASAGNVAWSVTLGAPGIAVGVGTPGYGWGGPYYRPVAPLPLSPSRHRSPIRTPHRMSAPSRVRTITRATVRTFMAPDGTPYITRTGTTAGIEAARQPPR